MDIRKAVLAVAAILVAVTLACGAAGGKSVLAPQTAGGVSDLEAADAAPRTTDKGPADPKADASEGGRTGSSRSQGDEGSQKLIKRLPEELAEMLANYRLDDYKTGEAIFEPRFITADQASAKHGSRHVMAVSINGDHRAYSIPLIAGHEVVNDVVGGVPVAITW